MYERKKSPFRTPAALTSALLLAFLTLAVLLTACDPLRIPVTVKQVEPAQSDQSAESVVCPPVAVTCAWDWPAGEENGGSPSGVGASLAQDANPTNVTHFNNLSTADLAVSDDLAVGGNASIVGTLGATGATTLDSATTINNNLTVTGTASLQGATTIGAATTVNNNLTLTGTATLPLNVEHIGATSFLTVALATDTDGAAWTIADGEIWFVHNVYCQITTNFDCTGDDCTVEIGDGNDVDGLLDLDDAELQTTDADVANGPAGWQGYGADTIGAYLAAGAGFIYAPSGESETIDIKIEDNSDQSNPTAGAGICYLIYTRFQ